MDVLSYRGPGASGGVSSALVSAWKKHHGASMRWWFLAGDSLSVLEKNSGEQVSFVTQIDESVVKGHYRYCNEFLWPILHDLPQYASYSADDRAAYRRFDAHVAQHVRTYGLSSTTYFVQDYQLALLPSLMLGTRSLVFWHIPWPKAVPEEFVEQLAEIARGLLSAHVIGFHTNEYSLNFMKFVSENLDEYSVDVNRALISQRPGRASLALIEQGTAGLDQPYVLRPFASEPVPPAVQTRLVSKPLGVDVQKWQDAAAASVPTAVKRRLPEGILERRFVLSVDRADYTKSVIERLRAIDRFLQSNPDWRGQVEFIQICGRSRAGLQAFDNYWEQCRSLYQDLDSRWRTDNWRPVQWIEESFSGEELAAIYRRAAAMLVNPVRDGLNLTAKEYAACQSSDAGVLMLSPGAGSWHEIGNYCLPAEPGDIDQISDSLARALAMPYSERRARNSLAKIKLEAASLDRWSRYFSRVSDAIRVESRSATEQKAVAQ
jgi:trehalose-6-phosphate synthase